MSPEFLRVLASAVLYLHFAVVLFNIFWLIAIPLGARQGWMFVRSFGWRVVHLIVLAVVALQAAIGALCFLTVWQAQLLKAAGGPANDMSALDRLIARAVFWPLPFWAFVVLYLAALSYAVALWWLFPPRPLLRR